MCQSQMKMITQIDQSLGTIQIPIVTKNIRVITWRLTMTNLGWTRFTSQRSNEPPQSQFTKSLYLITQSTVGYTLTSVDQLLTLLQCQNVFLYFQWQQVPITFHAPPTFQRNIQLKNEFATWYANPLDSRSSVALRKATNAMACSTLIPK